LVSLDSDQAWYYPSRQAKHKGLQMNDEHLKHFCLELDQRGFSINEIQKAIISNHNIVLCLEDVEGLLRDAKNEQGEQKHAHAREAKVLKALCEIKQRLVHTDCSPLQRESEALYQTIWSVIGEHYGWNKEEDIEDTEDQEEDQSPN